MLTYWPGRNTGAAPSTSSSSTIAASLCGATLATVAANFCWPVLQTVDGTGTASTQSLLTVIWQVRTSPSAASSSVRASSM